MSTRKGQKLIEKLTRCLLCGDSHLKNDSHTAYLMNLASFHGVSKCKACGFRFLNPRPTTSFYQQAYTYASGPLLEIYKMVDSDYGKMGVRRIEQYKKRLDLLIKAGAKGRLLEIGSCTGVFLNEARKRGFEVAGLEPSEKHCRIAKSAYGIDVCKGSLEDVVLPERSFDVVCSSHVFEHLLDPLAAATKITKLLRVNGFHIIEVFNQFDTFGARRRRLLGLGSPRKRSFRSVHHSVFFSPRTLQKMVELSGCQKYSTRNVYYFSNNIFNIFRNPKRLAQWLMAVFFGGPNIEIIGQKLR